MQRYGPPIPFGGGNPPYAFISGDWRIYPLIGVAACNKARSAMVNNAMGIKPSTLKAQNDISRRYVGSSRGLHIEHIANAERRQHAVASNSGSGSSEFLKNLEKQFILRFLKAVSTHRKTLIWNHVEKPAVELSLASGKIPFPAAPLLTESHYCSVGSAIAAALSARR
jgi:hypothetical protein